MEKSIDISTFEREYKRERAGAGQPAYVTKRTLSRLYTALLTIKDTKLRVKCYLLARMNRSNRTSYRLEDTMRACKVSNACIVIWAIHELVRDHVIARTYANHFIVNPGILRWDTDDVTENLEGTFWFYVEEYEREKAKRTENVPSL